MDTEGGGLATLFREAPITVFLGQQLQVCEAGVSEVLLLHKPEFEQGLGVTHGGIVATIADTAGFFAAASLVGAGLATVEFKINLLAPVRRDNLLARGSVVHRGRRLLVCQVSVSGEQGRAVALAQGTYATVESAPSSSK